MALFVLVPAAGTAPRARRELGRAWSTGAATRWSAATCRATTARTTPSRRRAFIELATEAVVVGALARRADVARRLRADARLPRSRCSPTADVYGRCARARLRARPDATCAAVVLAATPTTAARRLFPDFDARDGLLGVRTAPTPGRLARLALFRSADRRTSSTARVTAVRPRGGASRHARCYESDRMELDAGRFAMLTHPRRARRALEPELV